MKKIIWLIQDVNISYDKVEAVVKTLSDLNYEFKSFGVIPFTTDLTGLENILEKDAVYITISGTKVLSVLNDVNDIVELNEFLTDEQLRYHDIHLKNLKKSVFYNFHNFDQLNYSKLDLPLLNDNPEVFLIGDNLDVSFNEDKFIKPSRDLKAFDGGIIKKGQTINEFIKSKMYQPFYKEEFAIVSDLKKIYSEYRFFVVNKEVITGSLYKEGDILKKSSIIPEDILIKAKEYAQLYQPHDVFTMDLAKTSEGIKIVEYNCWNCSGHYDCDLTKIYKAIYNYVQSQN